MSRTTRHPVGFYSDPAVDGNVIVFVCDNALWEVPITGGCAKRKTARIATILHPILDTRQGLLAFAGAQHGPPQVCVLDRGGAVIREVTHSSEACRVLGWASDGRVVFASSSGNPFRQMVSAWLVDPITAQVERLSTTPIAHYCRGPGGALVVCPPAVDLRSWRFYRGGARGEILLDGKGSGKFQRLEPAGANVSFPIICDHRVYFVSDPGGQPNLMSCTFDGSDVQRHTNQEDFAVHSPATDGQRIVYCAGGDLFVMEPPAEPERLPVELSEPIEGRRSLLVSLGKDTRCLDGNSDRDSMVCCAFGAVYRLLPTGPAKLGLPGYCKFVKCLPNGHLLTVVSGQRDDRLIVVSTDGSHRHRISPKTSVGRVLAIGVASSALSIVLTNHRCEVLGVDIETGRSVLLDRSSYHPIDQLDIAPDGRLCAYAFPVGIHRTVVRIASMDGTGILAETDPQLADFSPGFLSNESVVFLSYQALEDARETVYTSLHLLRPTGGRGWQRPPARLTENQFHMEPIAAPAESFAQAVPLNQGAILLVQVINPTGSGDPVIELVSPDYGTIQVWRIAGDAVLKAGASGFIVRVRSTVYRGQCCDGRLELTGPPLQLGDLAVRVGPATLWKASLHEAWRLARDEVPRSRVLAFRWRPLLGRYSVLINRACGSRDAMKVVEELLGHLRMSHAQVVSPPLPEIRRQGLLGADVDFDSTSGAWRISGIPRVSARSNVPLGLANPAIDVREGDILLAIDGSKLTATSPPLGQLIDKAGVAVRCQLLRNGAAPREVVVEALATDRPLRYASWVFGRQQLVAAATQGKVAYLHLPDVSQRTRTWVERWLWCREDIRGLIVDVRFNEGGPFGGEIAASIARRPMAYMKTRWSCELAIPDGSRERSIVVLTNRFTTSGGELLAAALRAMAKAKIIGEQTFGGGFGNAVRRPLPDRSILLLPELVITWPEEWTDIENRGVIPDVQMVWGHEMEIPDPAVVLALRELETLDGVVSQNSIDADL